MPSVDSKLISFKKVFLEYKNVACGQGRLEKWLL
jgi:hypothetical protein